jgi:Mg/Co/Ni transporter MgtE
MMPEKKRNNRSVVITVGFFVVMIIAGIIFGINQVVNSSGRSDTVSVRVPVIRTPMISSSGEEYNVQTQFYVQMDREARRDITTNMLEEVLSEIMKHMDFDVLAGLGGIDYMNNRATEQLNEYFNYTESRVVVTGLSTDDRVQLEDAPSQQRDDAMRGLFQNAGN